ncbi:hypothetical protein [Nannocystis sp.]|uniref:hypothetical protein n=1 Tax=Nannocystis sp. TaxID=1962667 RepID=UPI0025ED81E0|nr:hypothetical protein [Nannocystis sp.]MBK7829963.1 ATP-binding protein [Nannocystis sp.]
MVHVHGYWFSADTLHTDRLLQRERRQLTSTLRRWIEPALPVVLGYGGWDDVLMGSLQTLVADEGAHPDIVWGFYGAADPEVVGKLEAGGGRVQTYEHVDMHCLLPALRDRLRGGSPPSTSTRPTPKPPGMARSGIVAAPRPSAWLEEPYRELPAGDMSIPGFRLLRAEHGVVAMSGREAMLADFSAWCETPGLAIRLVTAPGGSGKTRLVRELCKRQLERGWTAGVLRRGVDHGELMTFAQAGRPLLLAVDYAETWGKDLEQLLWALAPFRENPEPIRVVLAARAEAEWWRELPHGVEALRDLLEGADVVRRLGSIEDVSRAWVDAVQAFTERRGSAMRAVVMPPVEVLTGLVREGVLALHVAALLAVEGDPPPFDAGVGKLFDELLRRNSSSFGSRRRCGWSATGSPTATRC